MASTSPSPNSSPSTVPPASSTPPPLPPSAPPNPPTTPPSPPPNPQTTSSSPPPNPPTTQSSPPPDPSTPSPPPPQSPSPVPVSPTGSPPTSPPVPRPPTSPPLPSSSPNDLSPPSNPPIRPPPSPSPPPPPPHPIGSPPPPSNNPPTSSSPPPLSSQTPSSSPPPPSPSSTPSNNSPNPPIRPPPSPPPHPIGSPPPPSNNPPTISPPPPLSSQPPSSSPPAPSSSSTPSNNSPPLPSVPTQNTFPPPPPRTSPLPQHPDPPRNSPTVSEPSPVREPPQSPPPPPSTPPPRSSPPHTIPSSPGTPRATPPLKSPPGLSPPTPEIRPSSPLPFTPPSSEGPLSNTTTGNDSDNVTKNSSSSGNVGISTGGTIALALVIGLLLLGVVGTAVWYMCKRKKRASGLNGVYVMPTPMVSSPKSDSALLKVQTSAPRIGSSSGSYFVYSPSDTDGLGNSRSWFTYQELVQATNGFSTHNLLGEGGFGSVYKGCLEDGREVAVKQLKIGGGQGEREFRAEVEIISRIHHRHLVSLVGYCISENQRLLVYDYVPNNTLHFHLHGEGRPVMDWTTRVKIAVGAARGVAYLHEDCHPRIIHRDIKSSNILLDDNFDARVADFGLAKLALDANTHITTRVMGTFGYMAPEYASSGKLTEKSDVFSFGVVLLELITGRKPVDASQPLGEESLVEWARPLLSQAFDTEEFDGLADPKLDKNYVESEMFRMIEAAAACVRRASTKRPRMGQVVRAFDSMATSDLTNGMRVGESEIYNSAQQSAEIRLFRRMAFGSQDHSTDFFTQSSWNG